MCKSLRRALKTDASKIVVKVSERAKEQISNFAVIRAKSSTECRILLGMKRWRK